MSHPRASSLSRSRPTTPLRPPSRSSTTHPAFDRSRSTSTPLDTLEPHFAELSDSLADLEANFMHLQLMHESLARFGECFAAFLYGMNVRAFCVDFPNAPAKESFERWKGGDPSELETPIGGAGSGDMTFVSTNTSFVDAGSTTLSSITPKRPPPVTPSRPGNATRGAGNRGRGGRGAAGATRGSRGSGLARPRGRGLR